MRIQVLFTSGCENYDQAVEAVHDAIHMAGIDEEPQLVEVLTEEQARELHFLGSPSVHVDGVDADPAARSRTDYSLA